MTFICGYIYGASVSIIADSAETITWPCGADIPKPIHQNSTFQERFIEEDNRAIIEAAQKIYTLRDRIIITFAGSVASGLQVITELNYLLLKEESIATTVQRFFENNYFDDNHFIIGFMENELPMLYYYKSPELRGLIREEMVVTGGTEFEWLVYSVADVLIAGHRNSLTRPDLLVWTLANIQASTLHHATFQEGVGGYFNGVTISTNGIEWAKDTMHILCSTKHYAQAQSYIALRFNRDNATFIATNDFNKVFLNDLSELSAGALIRKWGALLSELATKMEADYQVLISYDQKNIVILDTAKSGSIEITYEDGQYGFTLNDLAARGIFYDALRTDGEYHTHTNFFEYAKH